MIHPSARSALRLPAGLALVALILTACGGAGASSPPVATEAPPAATVAPTEAASEVPPDQLTGDLTVLEWSGYEDPLYWQDFKDKYPNVNVGFEFGANDVDILRQMEGGSQADIFHQYTGFIEDDVALGLAAEIDTTKLKNWDKVPDKFKAVGLVDGKQYCVPFDWGFTSILYNTEKVDPPPDSWAALIDPKYKDHISMWDDGPGAVAVSSYIHGYDETNITDEQLAAIKQEWIDQAKLNKAYWVAEPDLISLFQTGDATVAYAWQGTYAALLAAGVPVGYAHPKEGWNSWVGLYCIRKDSPNQDLALKFLDEKLGEKAGNNLVNVYYYGHANQDVMDAVTDPNLREAFSLDDPTVLERTNFTPEVTLEQIDAWTKMWTEVKSAQ
jgi:spermidine/putrescine transport system substrate-binding protein